MKKIFKFLAIPFFLIFAANLFAFDFGGLVTNNSASKTNADQKFKFDQKNSVSMWVRHAFDKKGMNYFVAETFYSFEYDDATEDKTNFFDIDLAKLVLSKKSNGNKFTLSAGRFFTTDLSGFAYAQNADGVLLEFKGAGIQASVYGAYTGLLNAHNVKIISPDFELDNDKLYDFAEKYFVTAATVSFPNLFKNQTVSAQFLGTFRAEDENLTRMYATGAVNGPIYQSLFYGVSSTLGMAKYDDNSMKFSNLTAASVSYYFDFCSASLSANAVYASGGDNDEGFQSFSKITATSSLRDVFYTGIFKSGLSGSIKPIKNLLLSASCDFIFDADNPDDSLKFPAFQYGIGANWQMVSDFALSANLSQYFDGDNADEINKTAFTVGAVLSF